MSVMRQVRSTWATFMLAVGCAVVFGGGQGLTHHVDHDVPGQAVGRSFTFLAPSFTQSLFGWTGTLRLSHLGGVAFAADGDPWVTECTFRDTVLHRFDAGSDFYAQPGNEFIATPGPGTATPITTSIHPEVIVDYCLDNPGVCDPVPGTGISSFATTAGCGIVNGAIAGPSGVLPDGWLYSNTTSGVVRLDWNTGQPVDWDFGSGPVRTAGPRGSGLGIAIDPQTLHIVYVAADCHETLTSFSETCTFIDLDPDTGVATTFSRVSAFDLVSFVPGEITFADGIYFDETGDRLYVANRYTDLLSGESNRLTVLNRPSPQPGGGVAGEALPAVAPIVDNSQVRDHVAMASEPDGVAFHPGVSGGPFVVTLNEDAGAFASMSQFLLPGGEIDQTEGLLASGGFRGDLLQVGGDGCIYATQGAFDGNANGPAVRWDNDVAGPSQGPPADPPEGSLVRICGEFAVPPGVPTSDISPQGDAGSISGLVYCDANHTCFFEAGESPVGGVQVTLADDNGVVVATTTSNANGLYTFSLLEAGSYTVSAESALSNGAPLFTADLGGTFFGTGPIPVTIAAGESVTSADFGYDCQFPPGNEPPSVISGFVYCDRNHSCQYDAGDSPLAGIVIVLKDANGVVVDTATAGAAGEYSFDGLVPGTYTVVAPSSSPQGNLSSVDLGGEFLGADVPITVVVEGGDLVEDANFGYECIDPGRISGRIYCDENYDCFYTTGEAFIEGVTVTLTDAASVQVTTASDANGFYEFTGLAAGAYQVTAEMTLADGSTLATADLATQWFDTGPIPVTLAPGDVVSAADFGYACAAPGSISGFCYLDLDSSCRYEPGEIGLSGVTVTATDANGVAWTADTAPDGSFTLTDLPPGNYTVSAPSSAYGNSLATQNPLLLTMVQGATETGLDFGFHFDPFTTYPPGAWGRPANGNNAGTLLLNHWNTLYSGGLLVGGGNTVLFTGAGAVEAFLPSGGRPRTLPQNYVDPTSTRSGRFGSQVVALRLNVDYSAAGITRPGLGALRIVAGKPLAGYAVADVLALSESVLGGDTAALPDGVSVKKLARTVAKINGNFRRGRDNRGYLEE
jgi:hypothetical protein